jgi:hypothetical protein
MSKLFKVFQGMAKYYNSSSKRWCYSIGYLLFSILWCAFPVYKAKAGDLTLHWTVPCLPALKDSCEFEDSTRLGDNIAGQQVFATRFVDRDTINLGFINEEGKECTPDSTLFAFNPGTMGTILFYSKNKDNIYSCMYASYLYVVPATADTAGLRGEYFNNKDFTAYAFTRVDSVISFNWDNVNPNPLIQSNTYSVRWTGYITVSSQDLYTFYADVNDGVRIWIDGIILIDSWNNGGRSERIGQITLLTGRHDLKMEYMQDTGGAVAYLSYSSASIPKKIIPASALTH